MDTSGHSGKRVKLIAVIHKCRPALSISRRRLDLIADRSFGGGLSDDPKRVTPVREQLNGENHGHLATIGERLDSFYFRLPFSKGQILETVDWARKSN